MANERTHGPHPHAPQRSGASSSHPAPESRTRTATPGPDHPPETTAAEGAESAALNSFDLSLFQLTGPEADEAASEPHEPEARRPQRPADTAVVFDLHPVDLLRPAGAFEAPQHEPHADDASTVPSRPVGPGWGAMATALGWFGAVIVTPLLTQGVRVTLNEPPLVLATWAALAVLPPLVILTCSATAREAHRARQEQQRLTAFARRVMLGPDEMEGRAEEMGRSIRAEIDEINASMIGALDRMAQLEAAAIRNAHAFEDAVTGARSGATALSEALNGERAAFAQLNADLQSQTENLGATVARQIRMMREASHLVRQETARADQSLTTNIAALATSTAALGEKTQALDEVVELATHTTQKFSHSMGDALHVLGEATKLNNTARQSAETSANAAQQAAQAVRDASVRAAADARRVTEIIRAETKAMQEQAHATLEMLRTAAEEARRSADQSEAAAARFSASGRQRAAPQPAAQRSSAPPVPRAGAPRSAQAFAMAAPANDVAYEADLCHHILRLISDAGVDLETVFSTADLDYIAGRSRDGAVGRRRAVTLAAMDAVERIQHRIAHDPRAHDVALAFRAKPDLASQAGGRNLLKAYLLVDAALS